MDLKNIERHLTTTLWRMTLNILTIVELLSKYKITNYEQPSKFNLTN